MPLVSWIQHLFAIALLVAVPILEARYDRRLKQFTNSDRRTAWYRINIVVLCALALVAVVLAYPVDLSLPAGRESVASWRSAHPTLFLGAAALAAAYACLTLGQGLKAAMSQGVRLKIAKALQPLRFALPVTMRERRWWILVSLAAGVCEEILYRGFVPHYFSGSLAAAMPFGSVAAWLMAALFFGFAHAYQGVAGIVRTTLAGSILGAIALLSGGLLLPIVLHFAFDLQMVWMYRPMLDEPEIAARLIEGCEP
jgi:membrane protease YdiL (CAAX protease family)